MRYIVKSLIAASVLAAAGTANADFFADLSPFIGVDYYQAWMKGKDGYGKLFQKSYPGASIYIGSRFCENFGFELGYDWSGHKKKDWNIASGTTFFGTTNTSSFSGTAKVRRTGGHLDLLGYLPVIDCFDIFGSIGYGWVESKIDISNVAMVNGRPLSTVASGVSSLSGKGRSVLRLGIGANYMVTDYVGLRAKLGWETTSNLRVHFNGAGAAINMSSKGFKDSATLVAGAFVKF